MVAKAKKRGPSPFKDIKKGTLHTALGYKQGEKIPEGKINSIASKDIGSTITTKSGEKKKITTELKRKAVFAKNARSFSHSKRK